MIRFVSGLSYANSREVYKEILLQRLFTAFPGGMPGIALLLLRAVFGSVLLVQGICYLRSPELAPSSFALGLISIGAGALLLIGLLTPVVGVVVGLAGIGVACSLLPDCVPPLFGSGVPLVFAGAILVAIIILGPGAFSVDARMFGRREIIIPRRSD